MMDKPYHHGNLRNLLIEAGIELINKEGVSQFSLRKVAALCGVSHAAPYSHFKNKEELLEAMQEHVIERLMAVLENAVNFCPAPKGQQVLVEMGKNYVLFFIENPRYFPFLFSQACFEVNLSMEYEGSSNFPPYELFKRIAVNVFGEAGMSKGKMEDTIIALWATAHGLASIATMKNVHYDKAWGTKIEDIIWNK